MSWNLDSSRPIYAQIIEKVSLDIVSGKYQPGDKLPSVRDLAAQAGVNPNTMQKERTWFIPQEQAGDLLQRTKL